MGNVGARIKNLERLFNESEDPYREDAQELERRRAEFAARWTRVEEKARREAQEGNPGRLQALEEIAAFMRSKRENRRYGP